MIRVLPYDSFHEDLRREPIDIDVLVDGSIGKLGGIPQVRGIECFHEVLHCLISIIIKKEEEEEEEEDRIKRTEGVGYLIK